MKGRESAMKICDQLTYEIKPDGKVGDYCRRKKRSIDNKELSLCYYSNCDELIKERGYKIEEYRIPWKFLIE